RDSQTSVLARQPQADYGCSHGWCIMIDVTVAKGEIRFLECLLLKSGTSTTLQEQLLQNDYILLSDECLGVLNFNTRRSWVGCRAIRMLLFKKDKRHPWQDPLSTSHCSQCTSAILISYGTDVEFMHRQVQEHAQTCDVNVMEYSRASYVTCFYISDVI
ncbi:hypothetical protein Tco_0084326, partial [Tanacetum coccineum]